MICSVRPRQVFAYRVTFWGVFALGAAVFLGCQPAVPNGKPPGQTTPGSAPETPIQPDKPGYQPAGDMLAAKQALQDDHVDQARIHLESVKSHQGELSADQQQALAELSAALAAREKALTDEKRAKELLAVNSLIASGNYEKATHALDEVLKLSPSDAERAQAEAFRKRIEDERRRRHELGLALANLGSDKPDEVRGARAILLGDPDIGLPLVAQAVQGNDEATALHAIELLRAFNQPDRTVPLLVGILEQPDHEALWPAAIREIEKLNVPGAGPALLAGLQQARSPSQRVAICRALGGVSDVPEPTLLALLPRLLEDGPELPAALFAALHAVGLHQQFDLLTLRGIDSAIGADQRAQLRQLAERLAVLAAAEPPTEVSQLARSLGIRTRLLQPEKLPVSILRVSAELPDSPAMAALDGQWASVVPTTMWRHPVDKLPTIVLDLGAPRTVTAVKLWNYNESGLKHRGWKEVEIFVDNTPGALSSSATGIVPLAPAVADAPDYAGVIAVPCVTGRYVRIECRSLWQPDQISGLAELQVLGF